MQAIRRRTLYLLLTVSIGHLLLISVQVQSKSGLPMLEALVFGAASHVQEGTTTTADRLGGLWRHYIYLGGVARDNEALQRRVVELEGALQAEQAVAARTRALEEALKFKASVTPPSIVARVVAGNPAPAQLTVVIDRGSADGVAESMPVLAAQGVVGRVVGRPAPHAAQVQLLIGRLAAAGAFIERTGAGGAVEGGLASDPPLRMLYLTDPDLKPGDRVLTSGQDAVYPRGFLIGTIERVEKGSRGSLVATVRPAVDFSHLDLVLVVLEQGAVPAATEPAPKPTPAGRGRGGQ